MGINMGLTPSSPRDEPLPVTPAGLRRKGFLVVGPCVMMAVQEALQDRVGQMHLLDCPSIWVTGEVEEMNTFLVLTPHNEIETHGSNMGC